MSALPINPTPEQLMQAWREMPSMTNLADIFAGFHQAGVEAERARAAAETTEEWGVVLDDLGSTDAYSTREEAESHLMGAAYLVRITTERVQS